MRRTRGRAACCLGTLGGLSVWRGWRRGRFRWLFLRGVDGSDDSGVDGVTTG